MTVNIINGDCRAILPTLEENSFDCIVTSPPYWGLRDYGTATWEGGDPECDHKQTVARHDGGRTQVDGFHGSARTDSDKGAMNFRDICGKCDARRVDAQIGLEPTLNAYVETMAALGDELWRVLKPEGTFWLNLGDCYANTGNTQTDFSASKVGYGGTGRGKLGGQPKKAIPDGLKPKDLCGVPWRVAFALQSHGWWLRSAIVWAKPNPMPESVTDRPTSAYEMVFLLTKAATYFFDADAIREPLSEVSISQIEYANRAGERTDRLEKVCPDRNDGQGRLAARGRGARGAAMNPAGANARNVWTIATKPFKGSHFATMPFDLAERCIKAGCPVGGHVLDPFGGAGTTGLVADRLGRNATLIELNPAYRDMASNRVQDDSPLFANVIA